MNPGNRAHARCCQIGVCEQAESHPGSSIHTFACFLEIFCGRTKHMNPGNRTHTRCRQKGVSEEAKSRPVVDIRAFLCICNFSADAQNP